MQKDTRCSIVIWVATLEPYFTYNCDYFIVATLQSTHSSIFIHVQTTQSKGQFILPEFNLGCDLIC